MSMFGTLETANRKRGKKGGKKRHKK